MAWGNAHVTDDSSLLPLDAKQEPKSPAKQDGTVRSDWCARRSKFLCIDPSLQEKIEKERPCSTKFCALEALSGDLDCF